MHTEDRKFYDALEAKKFMAHKADRKLQTDILIEKLEELNEQGKCSTVSTNELLKEVVEKLDRPTIVKLILD